MTFITKEDIYDMLNDFETVYPEAVAAFRVAVAEMPEGLVRCENCKHYLLWSNGSERHLCDIHTDCPYVLSFGFCSDGEPMED